MKKQLIFSISLIASFMIIFSSCKPEKTPEGVLPGVSGKPGEILVVMDTAHFNHKPGLAIKKTLQKAHKALPQAEPIFDLINVPNYSFKKVFKRYRNVLMVEINEEYTQPRFAVREDVYAKPQTLIHAQAPNKEALIKLFNQKGDVAAERFMKAERNRYINTYSAMSNDGAMRQIKEKFGIELVIPKGYAIDVDTSNFVWIGHETPDYTQGILIYRHKYKGEQTFTTDNLINTRNRFTKKYVPGPSQGSYMIIEEILTPYLNKQTINGHEVAIMRGLWKVKNDFMGGPFVSSSIVSKDGKHVITVDGFVYAPQFDKRNYLRQIEAILYTLNLKK